MWTQLRHFSAGSYVDLRTADDEEGRIRAPYGDDFDRLVAVETTYDPENVFRSNRGLRPA